MDFVPYTCIRCNYKTKFKSHMQNHFSRKKPCPTSKNDIELTDYIKEKIMSGRIYHIPKENKNKKTINNK